MSGGGGVEVLVVVLVQEKMEISQSASRTDSSEQSSLRYIGPHILMTVINSGGVVNAAFAPGRNKEPLALTLNGSQLLG